MTLKIGNNMFEIFGLISAILLAFSSLPLAFQACREKKCPVDNDLFLFTWWLGSLGTTHILVHYY